MERTSETPPLKRGKKACTECRQQKAKCDAHLNPGQPCSRCVKVKAECVISDPFKREHKRQRLSKLQHETDELRRKLSSSGPIDPNASPIALLTAAAEMGVHSGTNGEAIHLSPPANPIPGPSYPHQLLSPENPDSSVHQVQMTPISTPETSLPRTLNGVEVTGEEVDELFHMFFTRYARFLSILNPNTSPNAYYAQSPFLFWAIIGVACRTYPRNPTLLTALARSITDMALLSSVSASAPWHTIQGMLLILTWPFPKDRTRADITFPLAGMLLHIAMQNGIHIPMSSHEFSRVKIPAPSEADMVKRSELWAHCIIVYQRACMMKGQSARSLANLSQDPGQTQMLFQKIAPSLALRVKCQDIASRCSVAVLENGVRSMSFDQERALDILLREFENQVTSLEAQAVTYGDRFYTTLCRLAVQSYHLFKNHTIASTDCLARVLSTTCSMIEAIWGIGHRVESFTIVPGQVTWSLLLSSVALLRILKSSASHGLDVERARSAFFAAINIAKQMSVDNEDMAAKSATVLNQLYNSTKAFRKSDGSEYTALRIRSRLVFSMVLDVVWWWRDEFEPQHRPVVASQEDTSDGVDSKHDNAGAATNVLIGPLERQDAIWTDDQFLADFEWALGNDGMFPPTEPYASTWSSAGIML